MPHSIPFSLPQLCLTNWSEKERKTFQISIKIVCRLDERKITLKFIEPSERNVKFISVWLHSDVRRFSFLIFGWPLVTHQRRKWGMERSRNVLMATYANDTRQSSPLEKRKNWMHLGYVQDGERWLGGRLLFTVCVCVFFFSLFTVAWVCDWVELFSPFFIFLSLSPSMAKVWERPTAAGFLSVPSG